MVQFFSSSSKKRQKNEAVGDKGRHAGLTPLEGQGLSPQGNSTRQSSSQKISDNNRRITDRLGSRLGRQISPPEDQGGSLHSSASCSTLAGKTMVPGPSSAGAGSSVATSITGRSPIPNRRADLASKPDGTTIVGMASAESVPQQLDETVSETLDNARASSTRDNYSIR
ncbi:hypothetical protein DPEC_G00069880 [Dallia pectoralis]|uniref:Uncharacterized protein n=1 Tax=Dallia pectoralis TaxID=75939 RepID=A0ACC2H1T4_DALPE|nr:hypothetical protein DPEC_G00069880 [Dallia pectoralis]